MPILAQEFRNEEKVFGGTKMKAKRLISLVMVLLFATVFLFADEGPMFPSFKGSDLEGNAVDESIFKGKVTVVNFWFSTCSPCVAELGDLDALDKELKQRGGMVIGVNVDTLDNNLRMIATAKNILKKKNASYTHITFSSKSEAGKLVNTFMAYPTTYVVDKNGRIVGSPILGGITSKAVKDRLMELVETAFAMN